MGHIFFYILFFLDKICSDFVISTRKSEKFRYVGWDIIQTTDCQETEIDQRLYQDGFAPFVLNNSRLSQGDHQLNDYEKKLYQQ